MLRGRSRTIKRGKNVAALQSLRKDLLGEGSVLRDLGRPLARLSPLRNLRPRLIRRRSQRHGKQDGRRRLRPLPSRRHLQRRSRGRLGNLLSDPLLKTQPDQKESGRDGLGQPRLAWKVGIEDEWYGSHPPCHPRGKSSGTFRYRDSFYVRGLLCCIMRADISADFCISSVLHFLLSSLRVEHLLTWIQILSVTTLKIWRF